MTTWVTLYMGRTDFSDQFRKIICHKRIGYDLNNMQKSASLVISPITVDNFTALFNCTPMGQATVLADSLLLLLI